MDNEEFLRRLSEVSEWYRPRLGPNGCYSVSPKNIKLVEHPGEITEQELMDMSEQEAQAYYEQLVAWREQQPNESIQPEILRVKCQPVDCADCGKHCENGRRVERKLHESGGKHWRTKCVTCGLYRDPMTGKFTVTPAQAHTYLTQIAKPKLGKYRSKYQPVKEKIAKIAKIKPPEPEPVPVSVKKTYWLIREHGDSVIREMRHTEIIEMRKPKR